MRVAEPQGRHPTRVGVEACDRKAGTGELDRERKAHVPLTDDRQARRVTSDQIDEPGLTHSGDSLYTGLTHGGILRWTGHERVVAHSRRGLGHGHAGGRASRPTRRRPAGTRAD